MKPRTAIDEWIRQSFPERHVTGDSTNNYVARKHSTKSRGESRDRENYEINNNTENEFHRSKSQNSGRKCVEKLIHKISKLNNVFGAETRSDLYQTSDVSTVASYSTGSDWSQCPMRETSMYHRKHGSPITISSGYESDFLPTCEEEIDGLLHTERKLEINVNAKNTSRDTGYDERPDVGPPFPANCVAWPGRRDLVSQDRLERHNHKLTKVKKSMRGIIKDLKDTDIFELNKTRRSRSFDNSTRKFSSDEIKGHKHRKSFSESRRSKTDSYFVMDCYHGRHWAYCQTHDGGPTICVDQGRTCCDRSPRVVMDEIARESARERREKRQKRHRQHKHKRKSEEFIGDEQLWRHLGDNFEIPRCDSEDTVRNSSPNDSFVGAPVMTSTPRPNLFSNGSVVDKEEHIYETIPGDDCTVDLTSRKIGDNPPELPKRNYKKHEIDNTAHADRKCLQGRQFNPVTRDLNNNTVPKFWDRLDGVSRDPRDRNKTKSANDTMTLGRPRRSPLSGRSSREERKATSGSVRIVPMVTCAKPDKKREELDITKLKKKTHTSHEYTVADVLDSISRFEREEPDLIQNISRAETTRKSVCDRYKMEDCFYGVGDTCIQKVARQPQWSHHLLVANETMI